MSSKNIIGSINTRIYSDIRGVDYSDKETNISRSPDMLNMWRNYANLGKSIETRPEIEKIIETSENVYGIFFYRVNNVDHFIIHSGTSLYDYNFETSIKTCIKQNGMNPRRSFSFIYNNILYIKDGINYLEYNGVTVSEVVGYVPTTSISKPPSGGGTPHEEYNILTGKRKNSFVADGTSTIYDCDVETFTSPVVRVWINDVEVTTGFTANPTNGTVVFDTPPEVPLSDGQDNVIIEFENTIAGDRDIINKCTLLAVFDNRVFFSGNQDYPSTIIPCMLDNPRYVTRGDFYQEGLDLSPVRAMVPGNNNLWVFKEPSQSNTTVFYHTPVIDSEQGKCYPNNHSSISIGCVATGINFNDDIIFFSDRGMEGINGDVTTEQVLAHRSSLIDAKLLKEPDYRNLILEEWKGYLLVIVGSHIYLADSQAMFTNKTHNEYEWFYWELSKSVICTVVKDDVLYVGTSDGVYSLTDITSNVNSYICTTKDVCGYPQLKKSTNKKGFTIDFTGDNISLEVRTDDSNFEDIGNFQNTKDYIVPVVKKKKWRDIQFKISSSSRFSFYRLNFEYFVGSYVKR